MLERLGLGHRLGLGIVFREVRVREKVGVRHSVREVKVRVKVRG